MSTFSNTLRLLAIVLLAYLAFGVQMVKAQVQLWPIVKEQIFDSNGRPLSNGCIFTYISGTNTPQATFTDFTGGTPNPNPIVLDASGRAPLGTDVWLAASAYRIKVVSQGGVNCASGVQLYVEDGISSSFGTILASNNTWTGTNTFNAATTFNSTVTMNAGFTSNGPSNLAAGGSLVGTFSGSPIFSGTPNFSAGFLATTGTFSGQITSTLITGTAPFVITSTTQVANLNVSALEGATWESPGTIGSTTPNTGVFTTLKANTSFTLNGSTAQTGIQGTDTHLFTSGTISGTGASLCTDANGGATTSGCASGFTRISTGTNSSVCSTTNVNGATCTTVVTITPTQADTSYVASCTGQIPTQYPFIIGVNNTSISSVTVTITNGAAAQAQISTYASLNCIAVHP
jgi:hypothetical protein